MQTHEKGVEKRTNRYTPVEEVDAAPVPEGCNNDTRSGQKSPQCKVQHSGRHKVDSYPKEFAKPKNEIIPSVFVFEDF